MTTLYPINERLSVLLDAITANGGELPADMAADWGAWFDQIAESEPDFLQDCVNAIRLMEMEEAASQAEVEQWQARRDARARTRDSLKREVLRYLQITGQRKATIADGRAVCVQTNGGVVPVELAALVNPADLDERFKRVKTEIDMDAVRKALESGERLEWAKLLPRGSHVRIR